MAGPPHPMMVEVSGGGGPDPARLQIGAVRFSRVVTRQGEIKDFFEKFGCLCLVEYEDFGI